MKRIFDFRLPIADLEKSRLRRPRSASFQLAASPRPPKAGFAKIGNRKSNIGNTHAMSLVIVLAIIVLLAALVIGFLSRTTTERTAASAYYESNRNAILADMAVHLVQVQVDHASTRREGGRPVAWASQPGMVRTFSQDGDLLQAYKLYSDDDMVADSVSMASALSELDGWMDSPAHFVDLNAPVKVRDNDNDSDYLHPIVDPSAEGIVEGFSIDAANAVVAGADNSAPMPVKWLYVLQDGTKVAPEGSGNTATIPGATRDNPIIGRIAFWTDDETAKLNINTASHGFYWDIPRVSSFQDRDELARFQPARNEFQRYPGHPATTSLRPVFGSLFNATPGNPNTFNETAFAEFIYDIIPRVQDGGSRGGVVTATEPIHLDADRLYASVDELLFTAESNNSNGDRNAQLTPEFLEKAKFFLTARSNSPEVNLFNLPRMAIWPINAGSGNSRPQPSTLDRTIAFCSTINNQRYFFQRLNPNSSSADMDGFQGRNRELWNYINFLQTRPIPGFGPQSFSAKYGSPETRQITTQIFDYIRSSNLYSTAMGATAYTGDSNIRPPLPDNIPLPERPGSRVGQVVPLQVEGTKGFGRIPTINRAIFQLFISGAEAADGAAPNQWTMPLPQLQPAHPTYSDAVQGSVPPYRNSDALFTNPNSMYGSWRKFLDDVSKEPAPPGAPADTPPTFNPRPVQLLTSGIVYFDTFDPNLGYVSPRYNFDVEVEFTGPWQVRGLDETGAEVQPWQDLNFPADSTLRINLDQNRLYNAKSNRTLNSFFNRYLGGPLGVLWMMKNYTSVRGNPENLLGSTLYRVEYGDSYTIDYRPFFADPLKRHGTRAAYPLVSDPVRLHRPITLVDEGDAPDVMPALPENNAIPLDERTAQVEFSGGQMTVRLVAGGPGGPDGETIQTFHFDFPGYRKPAPIYADNSVRSPRDGAAPDDDEYGVGGSGVVYDKNKQFPVSADFRFRWINAMHQQGFYSPGHVSRATPNSFTRLYDTMDLRLVQDGDVAVSLVPRFGDKRLLAAKSVLNSGPGSDFIPHHLYGNEDVRAAVDFRTDVFGRLGYYDLAPGSWREGRPGRLLNLDYGYNAMPDMPGHMPNGVQQFLNLDFVPDFDNAPFFIPDDAYINRADEGSVTDRLGLATGEDATGGSGGRHVAWYLDYAVGENYVGGKDREEFFSPNRQMPSAVMFGSLPTGVHRNQPWQTLLFRPDPGNHPGAEDPPDYLLLDLFWMPVVEPYAISEPFSSNGKVNMNYQIMPFGYINRSTAIRGVLEGEKMLVIPNDKSGNVQAANARARERGILAEFGESGSQVFHDDRSYKVFNPDTNQPRRLSPFQFRREFNVNEILRGFQERFADDGIFISETEVCTLALIPRMPGLSSMQPQWSENFEEVFWRNHLLTGDNSRERPYAHLLPKLTTRSNTYTVHFWVQSLRKRPAATDAEAAEWDETRDQVTADYRGSRTIERYVDPNDDRIPNYAEADNPLDERALTDFYRWRMLANREFSP